MTSARAIAVVSVLSFLAAGSGCADEKQPGHSEAVATPAGIKAGEPAAPGQAQADRAMRITIETTVTVKDVDGAAQAIRDLCAQHGGYVGEARTVGDDDARSASFEVHVPVAHLGAFRAGVSGLGEVTSDNEKAEDVTEQRADIKARLGNARASERRLLDLLEKRTGTLADVVAVEKELGAARETIERMEAQERVLEGQIASATVKVHLSTRHAAARLGPGRRIARAAGDGIETAGNFIVGVAVLAVSAGPTVVLLAIMAYAVFRFVRWVHRRTAVKRP